MISSEPGCNLWVQYPVCNCLDSVSIGSVHLFEHVVSGSEERLEKDRGETGSSSGGQFHFSWMWHAEASVISSISESLSLISMRECGGEKSLSLSLVLAKRIGLGLFLESPFMST
jgi:hypothetical protein